MADNWNDNIIAEFRANGGKVGGPFEGATLLLLHTTGAKSGKERVNPCPMREIFPAAPQHEQDTGELQIPLNLRNGAAQFTAIESRGYKTANGEPQNVRSYDPTKYRQAEEGAGARRNQQRRGIIECRGRLDRK